MNTLNTSMQILNSKKNTDKFGTKVCLHGETLKGYPATELELQE